MERLAHDALDASRMFLAAILGVTITYADISDILKVLISVASLVYIVGKAVTVWYHFFKERQGEGVPDNLDD